jgi:nicotinamidase-related amidase
VFIDHQPQMTFGVASIDRATLISNVTLLAKVAKEFKVPTVLTAVESESFSGYGWPQMLDVFPGQPVVERSSMNL